MGVCSDIVFDQMGACSDFLQLTVLSSLSHILIRAGVCGMYVCHLFTPTTLKLQSQEQYHKN